VFGVPSIIASGFANISCVAHKYNKWGVNGYSAGLAPKVCHSRQQKDIGSAAYFNARKLGSQQNHKTNVKKTKMFLKKKNNDKFTVATKKVRI